MKNNISIIGNKCCGCGLCSKICPYNAIEMITNEEGFLYPKIIEDKCKKCEICVSKCIIGENRKSILEHSNAKKSYMVISKNKRIYNNSASGGFATVLAKYIINNCNGIVYGCNLNTEGIVKHIRIEEEEEIYKLQDSKYVQSNILDVFESIKKDVKNKKVLFIGTPCQVDAIKKSIPNDFIENLLTCDLICHGVPSPVYFIKNLKYLQNRYNKKIVKYRFRNKTSYDKCGFIGKIEFEKGHKYFYTTDDIYYNDFIEEKNYRKSCYQCNYKNEKRVGDFTIGDVGSWELYYNFYPELSPSLVIVNNTKAESVFKRIKEEIFYKEISFEQEKKLNTSLCKQSLYPIEREHIYKKYDEIYNKKVKIKKNILSKKRVKMFLKRMIPFKYRVLIKKMRNTKYENKK